MTVYAAPDRFLASPHVEQVASTTAKDLSAVVAGSPCCVAIETLAVGNLVYVEPSGATVTLTAIPAGYRPIAATSISASTTVGVLCYF